MVLATCVVTFGSIETPKIVKTQNINILTPTVALTHLLKHHILSQNYSSVDNHPFLYAHRQLVKCTLNRSYYDQTDKQTYWEIIVLFCDEETFCACVCVRAPSVRQKGGTASRATDSRLWASQRHLAHHVSLEDVPECHGPCTCWGVPVYLESPIRCYNSSRRAGRHTHLTDTDNCTGERGKWLCIKELS